MNNKTRILSNDITSDQKKTITELFPSNFKDGKIDKDNFNLIIENKIDPKILYHYTSVNILQEILERIEQESIKPSFNEHINTPFVIRGTHFEYLNDDTEMEIAAEVLRETFTEYEKSLKKKNNKEIASKLDSKNWKYVARIFNSRTPFITSFSEDSDNLPMWNTYGSNGSGVAIGISKERIKRPTFVLSECLYDTNLFRRNLNNVIGRIYDKIDIENERISLSSTILFQFSTVLCMIKNPAYSYEKEWRIIKSLDEEQGVKSNQIKYQEINGLLKPYLDHEFIKETRCAFVKMSKKSCSLT